VRERAWGPLPSRRVRLERLAFEPRGVQSLDKAGLSAGQYISQAAWETARFRVEDCPANPGEGCRVVGYGSYARAEPPGMRVARVQCVSTLAIISLLPDCLAAGVTGTLEEIEAAAEPVEEKGERSLEALAAEERPVAESDPDGDHVEGAVKWLRRRRDWVRAALCVAVTVLPQLAGCKPTLAECRAALGVESVLMAVRSDLGLALCDVPLPVGLVVRSRGAPRKSQESQGRLDQQKGGRDPPSRSQ
jgi:hypothetical protein